MADSSWEVQWVDCIDGPTPVSGLYQVTYFGQSVVRKYEASKVLGGPCELRLALLLLFIIIILIIFFPCSFIIIIASVLKG